MRGCLFVCFLVAGTSIILYYESGASRIEWTSTTSIIVEDLENWEYSFLAAFLICWRMESTPFDATLCIIHHSSRAQYLP